MARSCVGSSFLDCKLLVVVQLLDDLLTKALGTDDDRFPFTCSFEYGLYFVEPGLYLSNGIDL